MKTAIARMMAEMDELREQRRQDQTEIEKAQVETRAMLGKIAEVLADPCREWRKRGRRALCKEGLERAVE